MVIEKGQRFTLRDGSVTYGTGVIVDFNPNMTEKEREKFRKGKSLKEKEEFKAKYNEIFDKAVAELQAKT